MRSVIILCLLFVGCSGPNDLPPPDSSSAALVQMSARLPATLPSSNPILDANGVPINKTYISQVAEGGAPSKAAESRVLGAAYRCDWNLDGIFYNVMVNKEGLKKPEVERPKACTPYAKTLCNMARDCKVVRSTGQCLKEVTTELSKASNRFCHCYLKHMPTTCTNFLVAVEAGETIDGYRWLWTEFQANQLTR